MAISITLHCFLNIEMQLIQLIDCKAPQSLSESESECMYSRNVLKENTKDSERMLCAVGSQFYMETNMNLNCLAISYNETSQTITISTSLGVILGPVSQSFWLCKPVDVWILVVVFQLTRRVQANCW